MGFSLEEALEQSRLRRRLPSPAARRQMRASAGVSQEAIAKELGVTRECVALWEAGSRTPSARNLGAYIALLNRLGGERRV